MIRLFSNWENLLFFNHKMESKNYDILILITMILLIWIILICVNSGIITNIIYPKILVYLSFARDSQ